MANLPNGTTPILAQFYLNKQTGDIWRASDYGEGFVNLTSELRESIGIQPFATYTALVADTNKPDGIKYVASDDSPIGDGSASYFISKNNVIDYLVTVKQDA